MSQTSDAPESLSIGIFYFSGTGNTKVVADLFAQEFKERGSDVEVHPIDELLKNNKTVETQPYDVVGFGYPVHAFNAPRIFFEFVNTLPDGKKKKTFVFKTSGDPFFDGGSTAMVRRRLKQKGYLVFHESLLVMPANVLVRYRDAFIKQLYLTAVRKIKTRVQEIQTGTQRLQDNSLFKRLCSRSFSEMEGFGTRFFGKHLTVSDSCTLCEVCVQRCPAKNIQRKNNTITFDFNCTLCMRCMYTCPEQAISPGFLKILMLKKWYDILKIVSDPRVNTTYVTSTTKGYFKHYNKYLNEE